MRYIFSILWKYTQLLCLELNTALQFLTDKSTFDKQVSHCATIEPQRNIQQEPSAVFATRMVGRPMALFNV
jgi:hypothetical protein